MRSNPAARFARHFSRGRAASRPLTSIWRRRILTASAVGTVALSGILVATISASASPGSGRHEHRFSDGRDGLGIRPGKIKHVWLIILENKSYDATFTGLNNNTYLWQTLPSQGVLLKNYYGTGHFSLDNYISMVSGQATQQDTQADCPNFDQFSGNIDTTGSLWTNRNYGQVVSAAGPNAAAGTNGCVYPASVPTLFNQFDAAGVSWKGYAQDLGNAGCERAGPQRRRAVLRRSVRHPGRDGQHHTAEPRERERDRPVCPQALPVPVVRLAAAVKQRLQLCAHRQPVRSRQRPLPRSPERGDDPGVQLDLAEQLQRRPRRGLPRQQPLRRVLGPEHAERTGQLHRRAVRVRPVPRARHPRDRGVTGVQGWRPDRHHVRRGFPAVHVHGQQLRQLDHGAAERGHLDRV